MRRTAMLSISAATSLTFVGCGKVADDSTGFAMTAKQAGDAGDAGSCVIPPSADTWDAGFDDAVPTDPTGCKTLPGGVSVLQSGVLIEECQSGEYGLECSTGEPTGSGCHPPSGVPIPGPYLYWCCRCQ
jgi:hypothetical protein